MKHQDDTTITPKRKTPDVVQADTSRRVIRTQFEIDTLLNDCAARFDAGGDGSVEAGAITSALEWLFGDSFEYPLAPLSDQAD